MLARSGVREVNLVAQELTAYGTDIYGRAGLGDLLRDLDAVDQLVWIRLLYAYPSTWTQGSVRLPPRIFLGSVVTSTCRSSTCRRGSCA